jgi:DNA-binding GntR family transcriptional regulator
VPDRTERHVPLDHRSLRETVVDALRQLIIDGELAAGERLVEERLAERLGVSRNPIREAIRTLESMGLITVIPRRGAYVVALDIKDIRLMQEVRVTLDRWIVQAAAIRHDGTDIAAFDDCLRIGRESSERGDLVAAAEQHRAFHLAIEAATKNPYATIAMNPLRQRAELVFAMSAHHRGPVGWDDHQAIRDAIVRRDVELAAVLTVQHLDQVIALPETRVSSNGAG